MPFPIALTAPQQATLRADGWWSRNLVCLNQDAPIFVAQSAQTIANFPFITFLYDNVTVGAYTSVWEGMVCYISETTSIRDAKYRGRVRTAPTSTAFNIDLNGTILNDNDYIIVVRDCDLFARIRDDELVDGSIAYHSLPDVLEGLPNTIVLYDADADDSVTYTTVQTPVHVDVLSTATTTWLWEISGDGTSSISNAAVQNPTLTFEPGYHYLVRVTHTNDDSVSNYQLMHVYAVTRTFTAPVVQPIVAGSVSGDTEDGWTASLTAYADVSTLIDRTHAVVWHVEHFGDDSSTPIFDTILMNGRVRSDSIQTQGSVEAGQVQQVTFAVEGITAYLRRLRIPNDIVRDVASPDEWGEITDPTPYRMAVYALWAYSTLTNIGSFGVESGDFLAYEIGGEPRGIEGGTAIDVLASILDPIKAAANYAPSGELFLARTVSYVEDRSSVPLIATFALDDIREYTIERDSSRTYAQVVAYGGVFDSVVNDFVLYTASAPSIVYGDGGDTLEITREILTAGSDATAAATELGLRASNHYAYENPKDLLSESLYDSYAGVMIPTNYQRWADVLPATSNTLGIAYAATDYWQLQSVTLTLNSDGSIDVGIQKIEETTFDDAQIIADQLPINLENLNPVLPVLPNDPAFPTDPLENYPTDTPSLDDLQPINSDSAAGAYTPFPPDVASQMAAAQGDPGCFTVQVLFTNSSNTSSNPHVTALGSNYLMSFAGTTDYSSNEWQYTFNFLADDGGFVRNPDPASANGQYGTWSASGWGTNDAFATANWRRALDIVLTGIASTTFTYFQIKYDYTGIAFVPPGSPASVAQIGSNTLWVVNDTAMPTGTDLYQAWTGSYTDTSFRIGLNASVNNVGAVYGGSARLKELTVRGTGTNPFDGSTPTVLKADAFYTFAPTNPDVPAALLGSDEGLFIDNTRYSPVPPYDASHSYSGLAFAGTNNPLQIRMQFNDYTTKSNLYLFNETCLDA